MTTLIETVARAIWDAERNTLPALFSHKFSDCELSQILARAALSAIEAAGYRVVPLEPTDEMCMAAHQRTAGWLHLDRHGAGLTQALMKANLRYKAMLAAAPKVTP